MKKRFKALFVCSLLLVSAVLSVAGAGNIYAASTPTNTFLKFDGFQVRDTDYNGLRSVFKVDLDAMRALEAEGFTVVEFGTLVVSSQKLNDVGDVLELYSDGDRTYTTLPYAIKTSIYREGKIVGLINELTSSSLTFTYSIVNYTEKNFDKNAYVRGYAVVADKYGNEYILYADYRNAAFRQTSLATICDYLYSQGLVTSESCISYADVVEFRKIRDEYAPQSNFALRSFAFSKSIDKKGQVCYNFVVRFHIAQYFCFLRGFLI